MFFTPYSPCIFFITFVLCSTLGGFARFCTGNGNTDTKRWPCLQGAYCVTGDRHGHRFLSHHGVTMRKVGIITLWAEAKESRIFSKELQKGLQSRCCFIWGLEAEQQVAKRPSWYNGDCACRRMQRGRYPQGTAVLWINWLVCGWEWGKWGGVAGAVGAQHHPLACPHYIDVVFERLLPQTPVVSTSFSAWWLSLKLGNWLSLETGLGGNQCSEAAIASTNAGEQLMANAPPRVYQRDSASVTHSTMCHFIDYPPSCLTLSLSWVPTSSQHPCSCPRLCFLGNSN